MSKKLLIILIFFISACASGPDYKKPETQMPSSWLSSKKISKESNSSKSQNIQQKWWSNFNDPVLDQIIEFAIQNNLDLKIAETKISEARAILGKENSYLAPNINAGGSGTRSNKIFNPAAPDNHKPINIFDTGFDASWEIDLFGGIYRAKQSFAALFDAALEDKNAVMVSLIGEVAKNYMQLRNLQNQISLHKKTVDALDNIEKLAHDRKNAGLISDIDFAKNKSDLINEKILLPNLDNGLNSAILRLEILSGKQPGELKDLLATNSLMPNPNVKTEIGIPQADQEIIIGAPIDLLRNRPDIKFAERNLASATALQGVAIAARYPRISLTSFFGFQNTRSGNLFRSSSRVFSLGSNISVPIFNFGGIAADIKISEVRKEQAFLSYKAAILKALEDVENSLVAYSNGQEKLNLLTENISTSRLNLDLMEAKYDAGLISRSALLQAKIDFYRSDSSLIQGQTDLNINLITLYKSLGGGWEAAQLPQDDLITKQKTSR